METGDKEPERTLSFHQRMSKIREKIFRNQESGLSLEGLIDVYDRVPWNPKNKDENSIKAEYLEYRELLVNKSDFRELATIGKGHFGVVKLVQDRHSSSKSYAMKRMPKGLVSAERSRLERSIMSQAKSEWITKLRFAFQDRKYLYLIMEYCPGGDLRALLDRNEGSIPESMARFYLAELTLAVHAVHQMGFVHRDIKPENILIDRFGHIKLTDFGSADVIEPKRALNEKRPVGTPNYVSPEVLKCLETGPDDPCDPRKSDFWSLGVVGYEMVTGTTPFADENSMVNTYSNIMSAHYKNQNELKGLSKDLRGLINGLLADLEKRFGFEDLVRHQFFINIDWDELSNSCPPYVPDVKNEIDTTYFDVDRNSHEPQVPTNSIGKSGSDNVIIGFSYAGKHAESLRYSRQFGGDDCSDMVSSLRRQNEDLRHRLNRMEQEKASAEKKGGSKLNATFSEKEAAELQKLCHTESKELRNTISRLEKMLEIERAERSVTEKKSLELLTELKRKWQDREEARVESVKNALQQSETRQSSLEMELKEAKAIVEEQQKEYEAAMKVKSGLKNKLKECKAKLESTIVKYEEEVKKSRNLERNNSALVEVETNRRRSEGIDYKRKLSECHDKIDSLEQNASKLQKDIVSLKKVNEDQKETIKFLTEEKKCLESDHSEQMKKVKRDKLQAEHNTEQARGEVQRLETENESAQKKLRSKDDKLSHLEELLKTLEEKIRPIDRLSKAPTPKEDCKCKDEVRMQKVEIRVLERKVADLEGRVKFLREVMVKEERDGKDKAVKELEELKESTKVQTDELERAVREKERAEKSNSSLKNEVSSLQKKVSSLLTSADDASTLKFKLDQTEKLLKSSRQELEDCENVKKTLEAMKIACLEVEDQNTEYETVVERLTKSIESYKASYEKYKKEAHDLSNDKAGLKKENNELKSKLIYTETQLKEIKTKHDEIETLYRKEEQGWNEQYRKVSCAKQEQGQTLAQLKNQLTAMAKNYDLVSQESADLKEMNRGLKEEATKLTTNVLSVKESNLKLNRVMEEMLKKIEEKNSKIAKLEDNLHSTVEERERKELEANTTIIQLRKLVDHLQSKNDALKHGKGAKSKKRHADQTWALSYEEVMDALDKERHKTRNLTEELRRIRSPLKSPRK